MTKTKTNSLVSVIVTTRNNERTIEKCLQSIKNQTYPNIELIVVDNNSTDQTPQIAKKYADRFFTKGPERSAQRNYGVEKSKGEYVYIVDADFVLESTVIEECVSKIEKEKYDAIVVHNTPDSTISWIARIRKFEVDMYKYDLTHSAARFFKKDIFDKIDGYDKTITAGEDYDIQNKLNRNGCKTGFIDAEAIHLGEPTSFWKHMKKYYEYGKDFVKFTRKNKQESNRQLSFFREIYFKNWRKFLKHPILGLSFFFYHICKFISGGIGYLISLLTLKFGELKTYRN